MSDYEYLENLTNGAKISVVDNQEVYHTRDDWGMVICNTVYVSAPEMNTYYVDIPGRNKPLDLSNCLLGYPTYKSRQLSFEISSIKPRFNWDSVVSNIRNKIHGRTCHITFDNDPGYYWYGRVEVSAFTRDNKQGVLTISIPECDPYKYSIYTTDEPWLWDTFDFETGVITSTNEYTLTYGNTVNIEVPAGHMPVCPEIRYYSPVPIIMSMYDWTTESWREYELPSSANWTSYRASSLIVNGNDDVTVAFELKTSSATSGKVKIVYRKGSL